MSTTTGTLLSAAQLGLQAILVKPQRSIGPFIATATIEETHQDDMEITDHPVELGAQISDHAYKLPSSVIIRAGWSATPGSSNVLQSLADAVTGTINGAAGVANSISQVIVGPSISGLTGNSATDIKGIYQNFLQLQANATLIDVLTGKRSYQNMLVKSIVEQTTADTENCLILTITLRQILIVETSIVGMLLVTQNSANPAKNYVSANSGSKSLLPLGNFSILGSGL